MATDAWTQKLLKWLETQPAEVQTRIRGMLEKGLVQEIKKELPAGWASKANKTAGAAENKTQVPKPKADAAKVKSVASNPKAAEIAKKVTAEVASGEGQTALKAGAKEVVKDAAKATPKGMLGLAGKYAGPAYVAANLYGRGKELYDDLGQGKTFSEAINKPESNKKLGEAAIDTAMTYAGAAAGNKLLGTPGAVMGGIAAPMVGKLAMRAADVAMSGPKKQTDSASSAATNNPPTTTPANRIAYDEIESLANEKNIPFEDAFRQLQERQKNRLNKIPEQEEVRKATPVSDIYSPSPEEAMGITRQATKAPIGAQEKDIIDWLQQPEQEQLLAELSARQVRKIETASSDAAIPPFKKRETSSIEGESGTTNPASIRPPPRFYVNTGRYGTLLGAGSRRSPDGRLY